jgi:hypothetical protein
MARIPEPPSRCATFERLSDDVVRPRWNVLIALIVSREAGFSANEEWKSRGFRTLGRGERWRHVGL